MFENRTLAITTQHKKEEVISPLFVQYFGVHCIVPQVNTDQLGTFSGEVERTQGVIETVRKKCLWGMEVAGCDLGIASEGSFGPHPSLYFIPANEEVMIFIDKKQGIEIIAKEISTTTNFFGATVHTETELFSLAQKAQFPSHALILRKAKEENVDIFKGITDSETLKKSYAYLQGKYGQVFVESDMRAMYNPTRMKVIAQVAQKLAQKINSRCPQCQTPGFGVTDARQGLPCELCGMPTASTLSYLYTCQKCNYTKELKYPHQKYYEEATFCDFCNP